MKKAFVGGRLKRLREARGLTQIALAEALGLSASYVNQLEKNQRPLTVPVLLKVNAVFGVDVQLFSENEEARLVADLREVFADPANGEAVSLGEVKQLAADMPALGRAVVALAADPDRARWNGQSLSSGGLAQVYGFTDLDGSRPLGLPVHHRGRRGRKESRRLRLPLRCKEGHLLNACG
ncbi:MAG: helix-turn-helix domain-containing protein, partial [Bacteroidales bacterium]|nr:helix-turn-helix domain-containing protein [Bacteroidales bacterium]